MNTAIIFEPKETLSSSENLDKFITMCRDELTVFGADLRFLKVRMPPRERTILRHILLAAVAHSLRQPRCAGAGARSLPYCESSI